MRQFSSTAAIFSSTVPSVTRVWTSTSFAPAGRPAHGLLSERLVQEGLVEDDPVRGRQVDAHPPGLCGEEDGLPVRRLEGEELFSRFVCGMLLSKEKTGARSPGASGWAPCSLELDDDEELVLRGALGDDPLKGSHLGPESGGLPPGSSEGGTRGKVGPGEGALHIGQRWEAEANRFCMHSSQKTWRQAFVTTGTSKSPRQMPQRSFFIVASARARRGAARRARLGVRGGAGEQPPKALDLPEPL